MIQCVEVPRTPAVHCSCTLQYTRTRCASLLCSGRMRGQAEIRILLDGSNLTVRSASSEAWEWFSIQHELNSTNFPLRALTIELQTGGNTGIGYFGDLCVSFSQPCKSKGIMGSGLREVKKELREVKRNYGKSKRNYGDLHISCVSLYQAK